MKGAREVEWSPEAPARAGGHRRQGEGRAGGCTGPGHPGWRRPWFPAAPGSLPRWSFPCVHIVTAAIPGRKQQQARSLRRLREMDLAGWARGTVPGAVMGHHMPAPAIYHSAIRLMLLKGPHFVLHSAPCRTALGWGIPPQDAFQAVGPQWRLQAGPSGDRGSV